MSRTRIVIDTNVIVSAAIQPRGLPARLLEFVAGRAVELCVSEEVLAEYSKVFGRAKFAGLDPHRVARLLAVIAEEATLVRPTNRLAESPDESDNRFYECAAAADADYIVTGNARQFKNKHPRMFAEYKRRCVAGEFGPGKVMPVKVADSNPQWVLNFATKDHWRDPSKLEYIERGLADLRRAILSLELTSIAIPALGCGLGQLDWPTVRARIEAFASTLPKIRVVVYEPN
jgi:putative PIN family toxin of toxin-antitoxin system